LTLTLDPGQGHTIVHLSSSTTCIPNFIEIEETFCGRTDERTDGHLTPILLGRLPKFGSRPKKQQHTEPASNMTGRSRRRFTTRVAPRFTNGRPGSRLQQ